MNAPTFHLEQRQSQVLTPRLQQAVRLLQLSTLDFSQELEQTLAINPFLEMEEGQLDSDDDYAVEEAVDPIEPDLEAELEFDAALPGIADLARDEGLDPFPDGETWGQASKDRRNGEDDETDLLRLAHAEVTLHDHLHEQLNVLKLSDRDHLLAAMVVETLDDDGYLRSELDELAALADDLDPPVEPEEMQIALKRVQSLDPAGVACRNVQECLWLQLCAQAPGAQHDLALRMVDEEFKRLGQRDIHGLVHALGSTAAEVEAAYAHIRRLDARPGWRFGKQTAAYLTPDVIVRKSGESWVAMLNPAAVPKVKLNQVYAELFQRHRESHHGELASQLQEARWTLRNLEQRFSTILRVAQAVVDRQQHFFEHGTLAMQPLGLKDIAAALELHESTVSRATNNKYMATPAGVFELKYFFSRSLSTDQGSCCSTTAIRGAIKEMIQAENGKAPLSDAEITRLLTQQGLRVARRTVTKYRQMMHIPAVDMRRQHS